MSRETNIRNLQKQLEPQALAKAEKRAEHLRKHNIKLPNMQGMEDAGENARYIRFGLQVAMLPQVDINDAQAVAERLSTYFEMCQAEDMKPTVAGLASSIGLDRLMLWAIRSGQPYNSWGTVKRVNPASTNVIKRAYAFLEQLWESNMQNGRINPASGIFLGKNNFGYRDVVEHVVDETNEDQNDFDQSDISSRYLLTDESSENSD